MRTQPSNKPEISVIMGTLFQRDQIDLLRRSVESILAQTVSDFEFLICDDGSFPEAMAYLSAIAEKDRRIRLIRPGNKISLSSKLNRCLQEARGEYIARMDDDDYSHPDRFSCQMAVLAGNQTVSFVGCNVNLWCDNRIVGQRVFPQYPQVTDFFITQPFIHPTLLFRREALESAGGYSEGKHQVLCEDYDLLLRLYAKGFCGTNVQNALFDYTIPAYGEEKRKMRHRWNESVTRFERFKELGLLPGSLPYVIKPLAVGLLPGPLRRKLQANNRRFEGSGNDSYKVADP